jgi:hypothetical protein
MLDSTLDHVHIIAAFSMLIRIVAVAAALLSQTHEPEEISHNGVVRMVMETICDHAVAPFHYPERGCPLSLAITSLRRSPNELYLIGSELDGA